nr:branchpoint-bridging protein-like [Cavia porcellus]
MAGRKPLLRMRHVSLGFSERGTAQAGPPESPAGPRAAAWPSANPARFPASSSPAPARPRAQGRAPPTRAPSSSAACAPGALAPRAGLRVCLGDTETLGPSSFAFPGLQFPEGAPGWGKHQTKQNVHRVLSKSSAGRCCEVSSAPCNMLLLRRLASP